jgi:hypothetical protein
MRPLILDIRNSRRGTGEGSLRGRGWNGICALVPPFLTSTERPVDTQLEMGSAKYFAYEIDAAEC